LSGRGANVWLSVNEQIPGDRAMASTTYDEFFDGGSAKNFADDFAGKLSRREVNITVEVSEGLATKLSAGAGTDFRNAVNILTHEGIHAADLHFLGNSQTLVADALFDECLDGVPKGILPELVAEKLAQDYFMELLAFSKAATLDGYHGEALRQIGQYTAGNGLRDTAALGRDVLGFNERYYGQSYRSYMNQLGEGGQNLGSAAG